MILSISFFLYSFLSLSYIIEVRNGSHHYLSCVDVVNDLAEYDRLVLREADGGVRAARGNCAARDHTHLPS